MVRNMTKELSWNELLDSRLRDFIMIEWSAENANQCFTSIYDMLCIIQKIQCPILRVHVDNYDMMCSNGHEKHVVGYGNDKRYKYCELCGEPLLTVKEDIGTSP